MSKSIINTTLNYSPNFDSEKRRVKEIKFIIFHYTGMKKEKEAIAKLINIKSKVSSHYLIKNNGDILEGELKLIEPLGSETLYHIKLDNINLISRHYEQKHSGWNLGMKVNVNFNLEKALFFDFDNKKRI